MLDPPTLRMRCYGLHEIHKDAMKCSLPLSSFICHKTFSFRHAIVQSLMSACRHMAPEVLLEGRVSKAADVYAFGITLWELYTAGKPLDWDHCSRVACCKRVEKEKKKRMYQQKRAAHIKGRFPD
eukprot:1144356-Pelagomonas_calceolata.AAC.2